MIEVVSNTILDSEEDLGDPGFMVWASDRKKGDVRAGGAIVSLDTGATLSTVPAR